jgi:hexosaminidase
MINMPDHASPRLIRAVRRFIETVKRECGSAPTTTFTASTERTITIDCTDVDNAVQSIGDDEGYYLSIAWPTTVINGKTVGVLHALQTIEQLIRHDKQGYFLPGAQISDSPRFPWRGLMIDCSRHFIPVDVIKRNLDLMERCKLNVFHWHLSDDQGFRVESKVFPLLQKDGSEGQYYTQAQIRDIVVYARDRGIRVVPEFDMPGHSTAWFVGYPSLASGPGPYHIEHRWGVFDPAMDPTRESTYEFLDKFIGEMTTLFPDHWFHIGGDEVNGNQWRYNPRIANFMKTHGMTSTADLQAYFNHRVYAILKKHGKEMIGWDEILDPHLPKTIAIQSWRGQKSLADAARLGYRGILSSGYYLNTLEPSATYYRNDPLDGEASGLTQDESARLLGGEACMWGEEITAKSLTGRIWPRAAAIAERLWSPESTKDVMSLMSRIAQFAPEPPSPQTPFTGTPASIPGTIDATDFDNGGEGAAYHDTAEYNAGGQYRPDVNVGIGPSTDVDGGHQLEYTVAGEWVRYTVDVARSGTYAVHVRAASEGSGHRFHFADDAARPLGNDFAVPDTGGWQKWTTVDGEVRLTSGRQVLTLVEDTGGYNIGTITFAFEHP